MTDDLTQHAPPQHDSSQEDDSYAALVRGLLRDLAATSITRLELRHGDLHLVLRREPGAVAAAPVTPSAEPDVEDERPESWHTVAAPLTGIFFAQPSPDEEAYVQVGSHVEADSIVGLIETMKMFNEVTADVTGMVREIVIGNGSLVEAGQPIVYIEPGESDSGPIPGV